MAGAKHLVARLDAKRTWCGQRLFDVRTDTTKRTTFAKECTCLTCLAFACEWFEREYTKAKIAVDEAFADAKRELGQVKP